MTTIITKNSSTGSAVPTSGDLVQGELAVNVTDKRLFTEDSGGTVVELGTNPSTLSLGGTAITATGTELNYTDGVTSNIQTQLDAKQALDADLTAIAALANTDGNFIVGNGSTWVAESGATARTSLGLAIGTNVQAYDADLTAIAALSSADGNFIVGSATGWVAESAATARASLGLTIGSDVQAYSSVLAATTASFTTADETKLDGIEALADVTDATNVAAAGAVMDGDFSTNGLMSRTGAGTYSVVTDSSSNWNTAYGWGDHASAGYLTDIVSDTTPQLGGMLDVNGNAIGDGTLELVTFTETASAVNHINITNAATTGTPVIGAAGDDTNVGISIQGKGTGNVTVGNFVFDADQTVGAGQDNYVLTYDNASGLISLEASATGGGGTVTSVAATVPTGFTISGSPITSAGTLAVSFDTGYSLPTDASQSNWNTAYGWGDHSTQNYAVTTTNLSQFAATTSAQLAGVISDETGSGALVFGTSPAITSPTMTGTILEDVFALSGTTPALDPDNGSVQTHTLSGTTTYSDSLSAGEAITLMIDDGTANTVTWPTMTWVNNAGSAPTLATTGYTVVALWKVSTTLYGALVGDGT